MTSFWPSWLKVPGAAPGHLSMEALLRRAAGHGIPVAGVVDIGASDGKWSRMALRAYPEASVLAVEPLVERREALEALKSEHARFDYALCAAGAEAGELNLNVTEDLDGSTMESSGGESRSVPVQPLDALVSARELAGPYLLKFDTHGYELSVLEGARETLKRTNLLLMEVYNFPIAPQALRFPQMCVHLEELGFRCLDICDPLHRPLDGALWQMDLLFASTDQSVFSRGGYSS